MAPHLNIERSVNGLKDSRYDLPRYREQIFPDATVNRLEDVGHYVMEEAADEVMEQLRLCLQQ